MELTEQDISIASERTGNCESTNEFHLKHYADFNRFHRVYIIVFQLLTIPNLLQIIETLQITLYFTLRQWED